MTYSGITGGSAYVVSGWTGGEGDTAGTGSIEPGGRVKFNLFFDIFQNSLFLLKKNDFSELPMFRIISVFNAESRVQKRSKSS